MAGWVRMGVKTKLLIENSDWEGLNLMMRLEGCGDL